VTVSNATRTGPGLRFSEAEIRSALKDGRSVAGAALLLGCSRKTVYEYLRRYRIEVTRALIAS
jgi:transcriptional regulator of acetoin/glycerol metabolism